MLQTQEKAPDFTLPDHTGAMHTLSAYQGSWVLLYFYPKDDTPGCTKEACTLRDSTEVYKKNNIVILGVSKDSSLSHEKFITKYSLPFTLLSDTKSEVIDMYHADGMLLPKRISYLISPTGEIAKIYTKVTPETHAAEVLADLELLTK